MTFFESSSRSIFLFEHDLRANASRLSRGKTGTHFSGSCSNLRNDVRRDLVFDEGDAVAQLQLALLQPLQPQQIRRGRLMQRIDRRVEIALIFVGHGVRRSKNAMRLRNAVEACGRNIVPVSPVCKQVWWLLRSSLCFAGRSITKSLNQKRTGIMDFRRALKSGL